MTLPTGDPPASDPWSATSWGHDREQAKQLRRGLSRRDRWRVSMAVLRGRVVEDPNLAAAAAASARECLSAMRWASSRPWRWLYYGMGTVLVLLAVATFSAATLARSERLQLSGLALVAGLLALTSPWQDRRRQARTVRAERLNADLASRIQPGPL